MGVPQTNSRQLLATYWRGFDVGKAGRGPDECPYRDVRGTAGHVTFARAYMVAWLSGHTDGRKARESGGEGK